MKIYDISHPLQGGLAEWPGDTSWSLRWNARLRDGDAVNLSDITMSVHYGAHIDAPYHFLEQGATVEALNLAVYWGPARVLDVRGKELIRREDIPADLAGTPRLLFKTGAWPDTTRFPERIPVMAEDLPAYLKERGVILVGLDVPSVDPIDSKELANHRMLAACGIAILESLALEGVPEGKYELIALPLKIVGA